MLRELSVPRIIINEINYQKKKPILFTTDDMFIPICPLNRCMSYKSMFQSKSERQIVVDIMLVCSFILLSVIMINQNHKHPMRVGIYLFRLWILKETEGVVFGQWYSWLSLRDCYSWLYFHDPDCLYNQISFMEEL